MTSLMKQLRAIIGFATSLEKEAGRLVHDRLDTICNLGWADCYASWSESNARFLAKIHPLQRSSLAAQAPHRLSQRIWQTSDCDSVTQQWRVPCSRTCAHSIVSCPATGSTTLTHERGLSDNI
jgi:hypothetical protein